MTDLNVLFLLFGFGWAFVAPIFNIRINEITGSLFLSGIILGMWGLIRLFFDLPVGALNDRFSSKKIIQIALICYVFIAFFYTVVSNFIELFILRIFNGIIGSLMWCSSWTYARRISKGKHGSERVSMWMSIRSIPNIIGPLIGGLVITLIDWRFSFYLTSLFIFLCLLYATFALDKLRIKNHHKTNFKKGIKRFYKHKGPALRITLITLIYFMVAGIYGNYLPLFMESRGFNIEQISIVLGLASAVPFAIFTIPSGLLGDHYGKRWPLFLGLIFSGISLSLIFYVESLFDILLITFITYAGFAFIIVALNSKVTDLMPKDDAGSATGIYEVIKDVGIIIGPMLGGYLTQNIGFINAFLLAGYACILTTILLVKRIVVAKQ
jgi:MFS family permease